MGKGVIKEKPPAPGGVKEKKSSCIILRKGEVLKINIKTGKGPDKGHRKVDKEEDCTGG